MATLRNTAISILRLAGRNNIAAATRHHSQPPTSKHMCTDLLRRDFSGTLGRPAPHPGVSSSAKMEPVQVSAHQGGVRRRRVT